MLDQFQEFLPQIITAFILPIAGIIGTLLAIFIKQMISKIKNENLQALAYMGINAIDQKYPDLKGKEKYKKGVDWLAGKIKGVNSEQVDMAIESAVKQFNISIGKDMPKDVKKNTV